MSITIEATYSAEDNKLRLYASQRLDTDTYARVRALGFRWAPKQCLFVAPAWSPQREDLCVELAGEISAEQTTLVERAEAKAERLDTLASKRADQANAFHAAAKRIAARFEFGQPILIGHHSERRARKDQAAMHRHMNRSVSATNAVNYWGQRAEGVERHANYKARPDVRARRIKTLLKELRHWQRRTNHAHCCAALWQQVTELDDDEALKCAVERLSDSRLDGGSTCSTGIWSQLVEGKRQHRAVAHEMIEYWEIIAASENTIRWMKHTLNRLGYERSELGPVERFDGEITGVILQGFAREHGAHKPQASFTDEGLWQVISTAPLPAHLAEGPSLCLTIEQWRDLMESAGYSVPVRTVKTRTSAKAKAPIINPTDKDAQRLQALWNKEAKVRRPATSDQAVLCITQARYSGRSGGTYSPYKTIELDRQGQKIYRRDVSPEPVCRVRVCESGGSLYSASSVIVLTDKPGKSLPIDWVTDQARA